MKSLWQEISRPIWCLAPMEGVTDSPFRQIVRSLTPSGATSGNLSPLAGGDNKVVLFTEFTSVEGMFSAGEKQVTQRLKFSQEERPLVAQIWGLKPENFFKAGEEIVRLGFDGVDLNFGCPDRGVIKMGACSAMLENDKPRVREIIQAVKEGVAGKIPVSVKTRIGYKQITTEDWAGFLLEQGISALSVHGRTVKELSDVPARWDEIAKVVKLRDQMHTHSGSAGATGIIGNGDVQSLAEAKDKVAEYGVDGVMIGRGVFRNPWVFTESVDPATKTPQERLELLLRHVRLWSRMFGGSRNFEELKKYFKIYIRDFPEAGEWRGQLMGCKSLIDVELVYKELKSKA